MYNGSNCDRGYEEKGSKGEQRAWCVCTWSCTLSYFMRGGQGGSRWQHDIGGKTWEDWRNKICRYWTKSCPGRNTSDASGLEAAPSKQICIDDGERNNNVAITLHPMLHSALVCKKAVTSIIFGFPRSLVKWLSPFYPLTTKAWNRVSQPWDYWHFELGNSLLWGAGLHIVGCLPFTHKIPVAFWTFFPLMTNKNVSRHCQMCLVTGWRWQSHPWLRTTSLEKWSD